MATDLTTLIARRDALQAAIETGALRTTYQGRTVEYRTLAEMYDVLERLNGEITAVTGESSPTKVRQVRIVSQKGVT
jgi:hypothetical protein